MRIRNRTRTVDSVQATSARCPARSYVNTRCRLSDADNVNRYAFPAPEAQIAQFGLLSQRPNVPAVGHPVAEHPLNIFNFNLAGIFSLSIWPLGLLLCSCLMDWTGQTSTVARA